MDIKKEFFGVGSIAVPSDKKSECEKLGWTDIGLIYEHRACVENGRYIPADVFRRYDLEFAGIPLVLEQDGNREEASQWHLHQDLVIALALKREGNVWLAINEGYIEVARLRLENDGRPRLLELRAEHLKDYLCARCMALYVSSYPRIFNLMFDIPTFQRP